MDFKFELTFYTIFDIVFYTTFSITFYALFAKINCTLFDGNFF